MNDLFHELLKYLNSFPIDYKPIPINDFLIKFGYKDDSLEDAKIIKGIIISFGRTKIYKNVIRSYSMNCLRMCH